MNKNTQFFLGLLLLASVVSSVIFGSNRVLCISENHIAFEQAHTKTENCSSKEICEEVKCDDEIEESDHDHCPIKKDCGPCVDLPVVENLNGEEIKVIQIPGLVFVAFFDLNTQTFIDLPDLAKERFKWDIPINEHSPPHEFKLTTTLLV